jgi:phage tail-like protein
MHLNLANTWPGFTLQNLTIGQDGALRLTESGTTRATTGLFMAGPFQALDGNTPWFRYTILNLKLPQNTHIQIFSFTSAGPAPSFAPASPNPFPNWQPTPRDSTQGVIFSPPAPTLWIGALIRGDGTATPVIPQIRIDYGRDTYLDHLPAIYRADPTSRDLLERFLALAQTALGNLSDEIFHLTKLFDPFAAPSSGYPSWLAWLCGWLAWLPDQNWTKTQTREFLAGAFDLYRLRGTREGLRRYLKIYAGVNAIIIEPIETTTIWSLGQNSILGASTMLAPASPAGAILDTTSILDAAYLEPPGQNFGTDFFDDIAYRFNILIHEGELTRPGALAAARAVIAREKPAHTVAQLCIIPARLTVGAQCRIGIDSVIGGSAQAILGTRLDHVVLAADPSAQRQKVQHAT